MTDIIYYDWSPDCMLEVVLSEPDDFLKIRETLTRIGIASRKEKTLYQSCHIFHKKGRYFITHFKELLALDGKTTTLTVSDIARRDAIALLLQQWGLLKLARPVYANLNTTMSSIKIVPFQEKTDWTLVQKYQIGNKRRQPNSTSNH